MEFENLSSARLFRDDGYNSGTMAITTLSILIALVEYPSMSAIETGLGQDTGRESWKLEQRCYWELSHKLLCNLYARDPCAVITPIYEKAKDRSLSR
jgi:hypothetical protein